MQSRFVNIEKKTREQKVFFLENNIMQYKFCNFKYELMVVIFVLV